MKGFLLAIITGLLVGGVAYGVALGMQLDRRITDVETRIAFPPVLVEHEHERPEPMAEAVEPVMVQTERIVVREMVAIGLITTAANIRSGQGAQFDDIGDVPAGVEVILARCEDWCLIRYDGIEGWVSGGFVRFIRLEQVE